MPEEEENYWKSKMVKPNTNIRCRKCNAVLIGFSIGHICPKEFNKVDWRTKVNTSHGRIERQQTRLDFMLEHPKLFGKKDKRIKIR